MSELTVVAWYCEERTSEKRPWIAHVDTAQPDESCPYYRNIAALVRADEATAAITAANAEIARLTAECQALRVDAERWQHASTSRNFGIRGYGEFGEFTMYGEYAMQKIDAARATP